MRRRAVLTSGAAVAAAAAAGGWWWWRQPGPQAAAGPSGAAAATGTARVVRTTISTTSQVSGALGYRGDYTIFAQGHGGTVTALPQPGQVISRGEPVFEVDDRPVRLFYADRPAFRAFGAGMTAGADVRALEENLRALGHFTGTADATFGAATAAAIRRWQRATGQSVTGRVELGDVTFQPGPIRVTAVTAKVGGDAGGGPLLSATSTTAVVTITVPAGQTYLVHAGDAVTVTMPDGKDTPGRVAFLSPVADAAQNDQGRPATPTVPGIVTLDHPDVGGNLDRAPVQVRITDRTAAGVLAVPITALVALAGGGYGVYLLSGGRRLVGVSTGLFADTLVEVSGDGLHEGDEVEVPAQ